MAGPLAHINDDGDVFVIAPDGRPRLLDFVKGRFEDLGFRSIAHVNEDPFWGPVRAAYLED